MTDEQNLGTAGASGTAADLGTTAPGLQQRVEEARRSISERASQIKDTVSNQLSSVDWREQVRQRPATVSIGALAAGFLVGYMLAGAFKGGGSSSAGASSDIATATMGGADGIPEHEPGALQETLSSMSAQQPSYVGGERDWYGAEASSKPGLVERFKNTQAFDRLQDEVSNLGNRLIDELSRLGHDVVLPALTGKISGLFGVDLSNQQQQGQGGNAGGQSTDTASSVATASRGMGA